MSFEGDDDGEDGDMSKSLFRKPGNCVKRRVAVGSVTQLRRRSRRSDDVTFDMSVMGLDDDDDDE